MRLLRAATMYRDVVFNHLIEHVIEGCGCLYRTSGIFAEDPGFTIQCGKEGCVCGWDTKQLSFDNTACKLHCGDEDIDVSNHPFGVEDQNKKCFMCQLDSNARKRKSRAKRPKGIIRKMSFERAYAFYVGIYLAVHRSAVCVPCLSE